MRKRHGRKAPDLQLGSLPVDVINRTLGLELESGPVVVTAAGQLHSARRHPDDYARCLPHLARVIASPRFIGDDFRNGGKIELIGPESVQRSLLLIAVSIERDRWGRYHVTSVYPVSEAKVEGRRAKGFLRSPKR